MSRPKPWETNSAAQQQELPAASSITEQTVSSASPTPEIPQRPTSLANTSSSAPYTDLNSYGSSSLGSYGSSLGGYGGVGGMGSYGMGSYGMGSMYGGGLGGYGRMGGYGSMYGGGMYGSGYGGYGMNGMNGMQNGEGGFAESTQATFQLIEGIIGAFAGFSQMLEATYMATYSSFFTMVSVAEQMGGLKQALGSALGIFAVMKYIKKILAKLTGGLIGGKSLKIDAAEFAKFESKKAREVASASTQPKRRISLKPLLIFLAMAIGTPILLKKLVMYLARNRNIPLQHPNQLGSNQPVDMSKVEFGRALYDFVPENPGVELGLKQGDLVAILSRRDPQGQESSWWKVRSRDGGMGYIPGNYVEVVQRKQPQQPKVEEATSEEHNHA